MPFLLAIVATAVRIARRPLDARLKKRRFGPLVVAAVGVVLGLMWDWSPAPHVGLEYRFGEIAGVVAIWLMVVVLVLATRLTWLEQWFGGLDGMYRWHRIAALSTIPLVALHIVATQQGAPPDPGGPSNAEILGIVSAVLLLALIAVSVQRVSRALRLRYDRWLLVHRLTGIFVLSSLVHGWFLDPVMKASAVARFSFVAVGSVGLVAYAYDELVRRRVESRAAYVVRAVSRPTTDVVDVELVPDGRAIPARAGQFVYLATDNDHFRREHPFSVAGVGADGTVRLTIRALGPSTGRLRDELRAGTPATLRGPYGQFDFSVGGARQIWVAGGIGIAPFLGWLSTPLRDDLEVDLFYTAPSEDEMAFRDELARTVTQRRGVRLHLHPSRARGRLTIKDILRDTGPIASQAHVFLCGPAGMVADLSRDLRAEGIPRDHIHAEHFAFR